MKLKDAIVMINEKLTATPGYWKLRYKSNQTVGSIDLHLKYESQLKTRIFAKDFCEYFEGMK
jgi:hypothetical protein